MTGSPKDYKALVQAQRPFAFPTRYEPIAGPVIYSIHDTAGAIGLSADSEILAWFNAWIWLIEHELTEEQIDDL